ERRLLEFGHFTLIREQSRCARPDRKDSCRHVATGIFPVAANGVRQSARSADSRHRDRSADELVALWFFTSISLTTCCTFGTPVAIRSMSARICGVASSPFSVTTPFF